MSVGPVQSTTTVSDQPPALSDSMRTASAEEGDDQHGMPGLYVDPDGRSFRAVLLIDSRSSQRRLVAVLASQLNDEQRYRPPLPLLAQIAAQLIDHGDVRGVGLDEPMAPLLANS
jgi:hypothetical protein